MNTKPIVDALKTGVVTVVFKKLGTGEIRTMPCTLNNDISGVRMKIGEYYSPDSLIMWALDKKAWRDVRVETIQDWYEGYPKEEK
jgi:hypothetical protein|tara:strand:+ start:481 stop:735 length:255 start_codon:yes stop_codon:yes gene_type:complete